MKLMRRFVICLVRQNWINVTKIINVLDKISNILFIFLLFPFLVDALYSCGLFRNKLSKEG